MCMTSVQMSNKEPEDMITYVLNVDSMVISVFTEESREVAGPCLPVSVHFLLDLSHVAIYYSL